MTHIVRIPVQRNLDLAFVLQEKEGANCCKERRATRARDPLPSKAWMELHVHSTCKPASDHGLFNCVKEKVEKEQGTRAGDANRSSAKPAAAKKKAPPKKRKIRDIEDEDAEDRAEQGSNVLY